MAEPSNFSRLLPQTTQEEVDQYARYVQTGGKLDFFTWRASGRPTSPTVEGASARQTAGQLPPITPIPWFATGGVPLNIPSSVLPTPPEVPGDEAEPPEGEEDSDWVVIAGGALYYNMKTGVYQDPASRLVVPSEEAQKIIRKYNEGIALKPTGGVDWQQAASAATLEETKRQFDIGQAWQKEQASLAKIEERHEMALQFEKDRNQLLQGIASDDWVRRAFIQNQPNRYLEEEQVSRVDEVETLLDKQTAQVESLQDMRAWATLRGDRDSFEKIDKELSNITSIRDDTFKTLEMLQKEAKDWTPQGAVPNIFPNAPNWLSYYVPGVTPGKMITPQEVPTPSGQQLTQMPTSMLGSLASYSKWAGGQMWRPLSEEVRKITESAALMQPRTPAGAGQSRWSPSGTR